MKKLLLLFVLLAVFFVISVVSAVPEIDKQIELIAENTALWEQKEVFGLWGYTVTDLDGNGRLEIISASAQGTGFYTYIQIYEVNEEGNELAEIKQDRKEYASAPDIMVDAVPMFTDPKENLRYYIFEDYIRNGYAENYQNIRAVSVKNGVWSEIPLVNKATFFTDEEHFTVTYTNADGDTITEDQYDSAADRYFASFEKGTFCFAWQIQDTETFSAMTRADLTASLQASAAAACPASGS